MTVEVLSVADQNMRIRFVNNPHRGIAVGLDEEGKSVQFVWMMGRSPGSQNRVYEIFDTGLFPNLRTAVADPSKLTGDPSLTLYTAMKNVGVAHITSNGDQTDTVARYMNLIGCHTAEAFRHALDERHCEPDEPAFTPRISAFTDGRDPTVVYMSILKADPFAREDWVGVRRAVGAEGKGVDFFEREGMDRDDAVEAFRGLVRERSGLNNREFPTVREYFGIPVRPGIGYCLTTYGPDSSANLRSFEGEPFVIPMSGTLSEIAGSIWGSLNTDWRVGIGAKRIYGAY